MDNHRSIWNVRYTKILQDERTVGDDPWLEPWLDIVPISTHRRSLDIGCGNGHNTKRLLSRGFKVTAIDISDVALNLCRQEAPEAQIQWVDVRKGLPFSARTFHLIVADLSLHYFLWDTTIDIIKNVGSCLVDDGIFAGRFNSTKDVNYGAGAGEAVLGEPNLFTVNGLEKRFFTSECFGKLFTSPWRVLALQEKTTNRFGSQKVLWEIAAEKSAQKFTESMHPANADNS